jgi:hypothetical protein
MVLVVFLLTPAEGVGNLAPLGPTWRLLQQWVQAGALPHATALGIEVARTVGLLLVGALVYRWCERRARQLGLLGRYA